MFRTWRDLLRVVGIAVTFNVVCALVGCAIYMLIMSFR